MNLQSHLRDALWVLFTFTIMGLCFMVQQWEDRRFSVECVTAEVQDLYRLDAGQARRIQEINYDFYDRVSKASFHYLLNEKACEKEIERLTLEKNEAVMSVVNHSMNHRSVGRNVGLQ